ncbi:MAG: DUF4062 domain-containing protein [Acidobacteriota bacterium]
MRIFISSTSEDLSEHRAAAIQGLRRLGHEVIAMEDFTAVGSYPVDRVLELVRESDAFVMLIAWRYGFVPTPTNQEGLPQGSVAGETSITEYELLAAKEKEIPILVFLLGENAPWPPHYIDGFAGQGSIDHVLRLRTQLMNDYVVSFFSTPSEVESAVTAAIANTRISGQVAANLVELGAPVQGGQSIPDSSYAGDLTQVATTAREMRVVTIDISTEWWSTRLFLLSFLLESLTQATRILIQREADFVGLLPVETAIKTLSSYHAELQRFSRKMKRRVAIESDVTNEAQAIVDIFKQEFSSTEEFSVKLDVNEANLQRWFGEAMITSPIRIDDLSAASALDLVRLLDYPSHFVPVLSGSDNRVSNAAAKVNVIDTRALSEELARAYVKELLDTLVRH